MRRVLALALMTALCITFCACGAKRGTDQLAYDISKEISNAKSFMAIISVTADYGERVYKYKLRSSTQNGITEVEVMEPDGIKGLKARISDKGVGLELDGVALNTGDLFGSGLSPLEAMPIMLKAWREGYITETKREKVDGREALAVTYDLTKQGNERKIFHTVWFDVKTHLPVKAEVLSDGYRVLDLSFGNIIME